MIFTKNFIKFFINRYYTKVCLTKICDNKALYIPTLLTR